MIICFLTLTTLNFHMPAFADESNKMVNELWEEPSETKVDKGKDMRQKRHLLLDLLLLILYER